MQVLAVVCEYNPFHLGHQYQLKQAAKLYNPDGIIAIMSGNFTQRGECAIVDKYYRTQMAIMGGADLVLELPALYATAASGYFAQGALLSLAACGVVDGIFFGSESVDLNQLERTAAILATEEAEYSSALRQYLNAGYAYPKAQGLALKECYNITLPKDDANDLLGLNYLTAIKRFNLPIQALPILRQGSHHNNDNSGFASSSIIRQKIIANKLYLADVPTFTAQILAQAKKVDMSLFEPTLLTLLKRSSLDELLNLPDVTNDLANRLSSAVKQYSTIDEILTAVKNKSCTYSRLKRLLCHLLLNITKDDYGQNPAYLRVLGFNPRGQKILKAMKKQASLPIITTLSSANSLLSEKEKHLLNLDLQAANIYRIFSGEFSSKAEYQLFPLLTDK